MHAARKAGKRLRYATEVAGPRSGSRKRFAKALKGFQNALGEHQDTVVARAVLRELGAQAHAAGENGFSFGVLHGQDAARAARIAAQLPALWADACSAQPPLAALISRRANRNRRGRVRRSGRERGTVRATRDAVADLRRIAFLLERAHESTYRVRAFRAAAAVLAPPRPRRARPAGARRASWSGSRASAR